MASSLRWNRHKWGFRLLIWVGLAVVLFFLTAIFLAKVTIPPRFSVVVVGILVVGVPAALYFIRGVSYEKAVVVMVMTLPLLYGFVIEFGGNFRVPYFFAVLAFGLGLLQGKLRALPITPTTVLLAAFVMYAVFSTALTFGIDTSGPREAVGFRLSTLRSVIQAGQLILMVMGLYVTINYITSFERLNRFSNLVFWSTAALCLYGAYDFVTALFGLHFYSIIYDLSYYAGGIDSPYFSFGDVSIPRPRSTLGEPSNFADFLLFGIPFTIASLSLEKSTVLRIVKVGIVFLGCMLFVVANSRAALLAIPVIFIAVLWLAPSKIYRLRMLLALGVIYLLIAFVIFPMAGGEADALSPVHYYKERMASLTNIGANLRAEPEGASIGRGYSTPLGIFKDHPIWGVGLGNYPFYYTEFVGSDIIVLGSPFSLYFRLLTELGIVGTSLFLLFVATMLWRLLRFIISMPRDSINLRLRPFALAALIAIIGVMIARVGLDGLCTDSYIWVMLGVGVVIPWLAKRSPAVAKLVHPLATD